MDDSFFGFDTSAPLDDDGGGRIAEPSEEEYDALNDLTFGSAINGDWEEAHESLVRLTGNVNGLPNKKQSLRVLSDDDDSNSDLELSLSRVKLDDVDIEFDDGEAGVPLDPSVWANIVKPPTGSNATPTKQPQNSEPIMDPYAMVRPFPSPFEIMQHQQSRQLQMQQQQQQHNQSQHLQHQQQQQQHLNSNFFGLSPSMNSPKICTLEDIERNIITQQVQQKQQTQQRHQEHSQLLHSSTPKAKTPTPSLQHQQQQQLQQALQVPLQQQHPLSHPQPHQQQHPNIQMNEPFFNRSIAPPGFNGPRPNFKFTVPHIVTNIPINGHRLPPGFPPLPILAAQGVPKGLPNFPPRPIPNLPIALNNFAMHPNFNAMRPMCPIPPHPALLNFNPAGLTNINQFNQRLVQEIQLNHPMLARGHPMFNSNGNVMQNQNNHNNRQDKKQNIRGNGNLPEVDNYANLMSAKNKHWLIGIQLSQLNTDTPYIDDYYYTVFRERKAKTNGESQSKAHKDNQLNHPLIQPKGHAQLVLVSMGNKNGTNNRNGQNNRERKNSESKNEKDQQRNQFQYENSLGKLQYCSVSAPRKLIDMEIMGAESNSQLNSTIEVTTQRKSRDILLHIETLYRIVLKLEDLENPSAIATSLIIKERKEKEKQQALEQAAMDASNRSESSIDVTDSNVTSINSSISDKFSFEIDSKDKLLAQLLPGLTQDKIVMMMNIRKGKALIRRILPHIDDIPIRWTVWIGVFISLQNILKKDKDDADGSMFALYSDFKRHIIGADLSIVLKLATSLPLGDKKMYGLFASKFGIASLVAIILRAEQFFSDETDSNQSSTDFKDFKKDWTQFLKLILISFNRTIQNLTITAAIESDAIKPIMEHFSRFKELKLAPLMTLFSQAEKYVSS